MKLKDRVALRIKTIRKRRRITQAQLAERIDRTVFAVSQLERGLSLPSFETLERLSRALNVPVREFFDETGQQTEENPRRARTMVTMLDLLRNLTDDDVETALQLIEIFHSSGKKRNAQRRGR